MDRKRLIILIAFLATTALLGYGLYYFFFKKSAAPPPSVPGTAEEEDLLRRLPESAPGAPRGGEKIPGALPVSGATRQEAIRRAQAAGEEIRLVVDDIVGARADKNGNARFYNNTDGKFYRVGRDGRITLLSDQVFYNVKNVTWSPVSDESIIEYPDGSNIYYNFQTRLQVTLPKHWEEFSFAGGGDRIAMKSIGLSPENRWIVAANPDGTGIKLVNALGENADKVTVDWSPSNQVVALARTGEPLGGDREELLFVGLNGENFKSTIVEGRGLESRWAPDGNKLLYSVYSARNDYKPELWIVNAEGDNIGSGRRLLSVETWASKCAFGDARTVYCGVPRDLPTGAGFAPALADSIQDRLIRIDTQTGARTEIPFVGSHTVDTVSVSADGKTLYFTDKTQTGIFQVAL